MNSQEATLPDSLGHFGPYGGRFVPETLMSALEELEAEYAASRKSEDFQNRLYDYNTNYAGRPTPLYFARNLTTQFGGARIYLKREDLTHTGAHKINNALGQALLAQHMGKWRIIAETGAGQHGVATATACAMLGLECVVYMGEEDMRRQAINVYRMRLLGAEVRAVTAGSRTLKDAINEAIRDWVTNVETTHYLLGSVVGPHPYPMMVRDFQSVIGIEARRQMLEAEGRLPDYAVACVGGGSNSMGLFYPFLDDTSVKLVGVEAGGMGVDSGSHASTLGRRKTRCASRLHVLPAPGRARTGEGDPQHLSWPGLPRSRPRAQPSERHRAGGVHRRHGLTGPGGLPPALPNGGHHPRPGAVPRHLLRQPTSPDAAPGHDYPGLPKRPRRQGRGHGGTAGGVGIVQSAY